MAQAIFLSSERSSGSVFYYGEVPPVCLWLVLYETLHTSRSTRPWEVFFLSAAVALPGMGWWRLRKGGERRMDAGGSRRYLLVCSGISSCRSSHDFIPPAGSWYAAPLAGASPRSIERYPRP